MSCRLAMFCGCICNRSRFDGTEASYHQCVGLLTGMKHIRNDKVSNHEVCAEKHDQDNCGYRQDQ